MSHLCLTSLEDNHRFPIPTSHDIVSTLAVILACINFRIALRARACTCVYRHNRGCLPALTSYLIRLLSLRTSLRSLFYRPSPPSAPTSHRDPTIDVASAYIALFHWQEISIVLSPLFKNTALIKARNFSRHRVALFSLLLGNGILSAQTYQRRGAAQHASPDEYSGPNVARTFYSAVLPSYLPNPSIGNYSGVFCPNTPTLTTSSFYIILSSLDNLTCFHPPFSFFNRRSARSSAPRCNHRKRSYHKSSTYQVLFHNSSFIKSSG